MDRYYELEESDLDESSNIYSEKSRDNLLDNDEIDSYEDGFMQGWDDAL